MKISIAKFDTDFVQDLDIDTEESRDPMKNLIIEERNKLMVEAVAGRPREGTALKSWDSDWNADFTQGKGEGRVIFLYGKFVLLLHLTWSAD